MSSASLKKLRINRHGLSHGSVTLVNEHIVIVLQCIAMEVPRLPNMMMKRNCSVDAAINA